MIRLRLYVLAMFILQSLTTMGQTENISLLLDKKWVIKEYVIGGQIFPATDIKNGDYSIFMSNHNVESNSRGLIQRGKWKLDTKGKILTLYSDETGVSSEMRIQMLTETEFKFEVSTPEGMEMVVVMRTE